MVIAICKPVKCNSIKRFPTQKCFPKYLLLSELTVLLSDFEHLLSIFFSLAIVGHHVFVIFSRHGRAVVL